MVKGLQNLMPNKAGTMRLKNGSIANYGSIRIENENFIHYTGAGLRELFPQSGTPKHNVKDFKEEDLIKMEYLSITPLSEIEEIF